MPLNFVGAFKVIARLPGGPMELPEYFRYYMGDTTITGSDGGFFKLSLNPTFMDKSFEFKLGEEYTQAIDGGLTFKNKMTVEGDNVLVQTGIDQQSNKTYKILRIYNGKPISVYAHKEQVEIRMMVDGEMLPWMYVMVTR